MSEFIPYECLAATAYQEHINAEEFACLAEKHPKDALKYRNCAALAQHQAENAEALMSVQREATGVRHG